MEKNEKEFILPQKYGQSQHEYVLRDHLGNTRVTFRDGVNRGLELEDPNGGPSVVGVDWGYDDGVVTEADIKHINHTYPFGMAMEGNWNNAGTANNNKYLYNGKQYNDDFGMGWYDYGARFYDPSIARWSVVDPMAEARISLSGYQYVQNRPMNLVDPTGMLDAKSMYGGTYGYDSQQASKKSVSDRMDDADDKQFNDIGARKVNDLEGNSHPITEDNIEGSYDVAGVWKTTATAGGYSTTTYNVVLQKSGTKSCCAGAIAFFATGETIAAESSVIPPAAAVIAIGVAIGAGLYATYEYFHPADRLNERKFNKYDF